MKKSYNNIFFISGGGTKFIALLSAFIRLLNKDFKFKIAGGVSAGAILLWLYIGGLFTLKRAIHVGLNLTTKTFFSINPFGLYGILKALLGIILAKTFISKLTKRRISWLGEMGNLEKLLKLFVSEQQFNYYQMDKNSPDLYILAINRETRNKKIWNLKTIETYEKAIKCVLASSSIAPFIKPVKIDGQYYYDGGHRDHSPGSTILSQVELNFSVEKIVTLFTRPKNNEYKKEDFLDMEDITDVLLNFVIDTSNIEISKTDEIIENDLAKHLKAEYIPIYIKRFTKGFYDTNKQRLQKGFNIGKTAVNELYS